MIGAPNTRGQKYWVGIVEWAPESSVSEEIADIFRNYDIDIYIYFQLLNMHVQHGRGVIYHMFFVSRRLNFSIRNSYSLMTSFVNLVSNGYEVLVWVVIIKSNVMTHGFCPKLITGGWYIFHFFIPLLLCEAFFNASGEFPRCWWIEIVKCI